MPPALQAFLGVCALLVTVLQLAGRFGWWARSVSTDDLASEVKTLRAWRHKVGDDPCDALSKLVTIYDHRMDARVTKLEARVFNGHTK